MADFLIIASLSVIAVVVGMLLVQNARTRTFDRDGSWTRYCSVGRHSLLSRSAGHYVVTVYDGSGTVLRRRKFAGREQAIGYAQFVFGPDRLDGVELREDQQTLLVLRDMSALGQEGTRSALVEVRAILSPPMKAALRVVQTPRKTSRDTKRPAAKLRLPRRLNRRR